MVLPANHLAIGKSQDTLMLSRCHLISLLNLLIKVMGIQKAGQRSILPGAPVAQSQPISPAPERSHIGKRPAKVLIFRPQELSRAASGRSPTCRIFNRVHKGKGLLAVGERHSEVPSLKKAGQLAMPVVAAMGRF